MIFLFSLWSLLINMIVALVLIVASIILIVVLHDLEKRSIHKQQNAILSFDTHFCKTSKQKRFWGFVIDMLVYSLCQEGLLKLLHQLFGVGKDSIFAVLMIVCLHFAYFCLLEVQMAQTFGKIVLQTEVLRMDGERIDFQTAFKRYLCKFIPFDAVSYWIGRGWHDTFSFTTVVDKFKRPS